MSQPKPPRKRWPRRKAKPGELIAYWGKLPHEQPDICFAWGGNGATSGDGHLIHGMFSGYGWKDPTPMTKSRFYGYLKELELRGYDLTTLRFSIQKKAQPPENSAE